MDPLTIFIALVIIGLAILLGYLIEAAVFVGKQMKKGRAEGSDTYSLTDHDWKKFKNKS